MFTLGSAVLLTFSAVALVVRVQPVTNIPRLVLAVAATFVPLVALAGLMMALLSRRIGLALAGVFLVTVTVAIQVSWYYFGKPSRFDRFTEIRVLSSNLRHGRADPASLVSLARREADVISVAELTQQAVEGFSKEGIGEVFKYRLLVGAVGVWSRFPLKPLSTARHRAVSMPAARAQIPGLDFEPVIASVHVMSPVAGDENTVDDWRYGMAGAKAQLDNFAREAGPGAVIIGGDYNSTPDMRQFRDLLTNGYRDAVQQTGAGFAPTFKADSWLPPVITIDHILIRNAAASSIKTVKIKGTDHRALLATIQIPLEPSA